MKSHTRFLNAVRQRLQKKGFSHEISENLIGLLKTMLTNLGIEPGADKETVTSLVDALTSNGNVLSLLQQQAAELDALKRITVNLTRSLDLQAVLDEVVREALQLVKNAQDSHIFLYQNKKLTFGASLNENGQKNVEFAEPRPNGLTYLVARTREMVVVEDIKTHPLYQGIREDWTGSIISIPLIMGDRSIGVMNLARTRPGSFSDSEVRLLTLLADQASIAILNARLHQVVSQQALIDGLTGMPNRRALDKRLDEEIEAYGHTGCVFCVIMMDLDGFKLVNDTYGHDVGDEVLRQIARSLQDNLRASDFVARYGGDELTLVLSDTDLHQAKVVVEKVRSNLANLPISLPDGNIITMDISGGIALHPAHAKTAPGLLRAADEALYKAKRSGGGTFEVAQSINA